MDKEIQEKKVAKVTRELQQMDKQKYQAELKAQEAVKEVREAQKWVQNSAKSDVRI